MTTCPCLLFGPRWLRAFAHTGQAHAETRRVTPACAGVERARAGAEGTAGARAGVCVGVCVCHSIGLPSEFVTSTAHARPFGPVPSPYSTR